MVKNQKDKPRILFWGMVGDFTNHVLTSLIAEDLCPIGIIIPDFQKKDASNSIELVVPEISTSSLPIINPFMHASIYQTAWQNNVRLFKIRSLTAPAVKQALEDLQPSIAIVACFPKRIPNEILSLPAHGFLNLHPSLLPSLRGPYPLFWTFRLGQPPGITIHMMDESLDTGNIIFQNPVTFPDGISGSEANFLMAKEGTNLLLDTLKMLAKGSIENKPRKDIGSIYSRPTTKDFSIPTSWTARRAFNFICGTTDWGQPYLINGADFSFKVRSAVSYNPESTLSKPFRKNGVDLWIRFSPGILHVKQ